MEMQSSMATPPTLNAEEAPPAKKGLKALMESSLKSSSSFKEDSYFISSLKDSERKALDDFKSKLQNCDVFAKNEADSKTPQMWGVPLLGGDDRADVILLKFLRARDFRVSEAMTMLVKCLEWRKEFGVDGIVDEDLGMKELEGVVAYMHSYDREGHPVCYNAYGVFKDKEMYEKIFGDEEKLKKFLRWRVQVLERGINLLHFKPGAVNSMIQITDLKNMPKRELRVASSHILSVFQDNYPEMVARKIFVNVPWYFSMIYSMFSPFLTQRTKSKFVIARETNVAETLYKYIRPEDVPIRYGGLSEPEDSHSWPVKPASEFSIKGGEKVLLEIEGIEGGAAIVWDLVVGGWELNYGAEFIPCAEGGYTISVEKMRKMVSGDRPIHNSFTAREHGKLVLSIDNTLSRRKKVAAYRYLVRKSSVVSAP